MAKYKIKPNIEVAKIVKEPTVKRTFSIPQTLDKALRLKAVMEDKKISDVLSDALRNYLYDYVKKIDKDEIEVEKQNEVEE